MGANTETKFDPVEKPEHYVKDGAECIDWIETALTSEEFRGYLRGNMLKYFWRYADKGDPRQDLDKMLWYAKKLREKATADCYVDTPKDETLLTFDLHCDIDQDKVWKNFGYVKEGGLDESLKQCCCDKDTKVDTGKRQVIVEVDDVNDFILRTKNRDYLLDWNKLIEFFGYIDGGEPTVDWMELPTSGKLALHVRFKNPKQFDAAKDVEKGECSAYGYLRKLYEAIGYTMSRELDDALFRMIAFKSDYEVSANNDMNMIMLEVEL